jgi:fucose 4-O-acetylase-like acetyltransferase
MGRIVWIDATKGYAISLVVFGHVLGGAMARGWLSPADGDVPKLIYDYIYSFHMPLFFLISGALTINGIRSDPLRAKLSRVGSIAWPYVLWGMIGIVLLPVVSQFTLNSTHGFSFYEGWKQLLLGESSWFLWTLFLAHCVLVTASQIMPVRVTFFLTVIASVILGKEDIGTLRAVFQFMPFLALGAVFGERINIFKLESRVASVVAGTLLFSVLFVLVLVHVNEIPIISLCCGIIGAIASLIIVQSIGARWLNLLMAQCGAASLVVFLLHPYFQGTARELGRWAIGPSLWWQLTIPTVAGVVAPTLIWLGAERVGLQWLFRLDLARFASRNRVERRSVG